MMKSYLMLIISISILSAFWVGCATTKLDEYTTKTPDEEEIIKVMTRAQNGWNTPDENEFLAGFCDNGQFAYSAGSIGEKGKVSKDKIPNIFQPAHNTMNSSIKLVNPKFSIAGDEAKLKCQDFSGYKINHKILFIRESGKWCIRDWDWDWF